MSYVEQITRGLWRPWPWWELSINEKCHLFSNSDFCRPDAAYLVSLY